jgi:hypothetical protein
LELPMKASAAASPACVPLPVEVESPPQAAMAAALAPSAKSAARLRRTRGDLGNGDTAADAVSALAQNGHADSDARTWRAQEGHGRSRALIPED